LCSEKWKFLTDVSGPLVLPEKRRKWNWIGHTLRKGHEAIEREALDWNPQGKRRRRRPRHTWRKTVHNEPLEKVKSWSEVKRMTGNRTR
jgi:hypothetical protein